ncbi:MAG: cation:proton antiporter [Candidatus Pacebacteria bacterium]|nr:cation:proton antiporter [Candidatus Paceibacterota bacterium]MCF7862997.1 cation:proton antiporter [Candidatus Paceibacterota bacterium]
MKILKYLVVFLFVSLVSLPVFNLFASGDAGEVGGHTAFASTFLWIAVILIFAKVASLVEKVGQPAVLGELVMGVVLGNLGLLGIHFLDPIGTDSIIAFLAELGVVVLLFQIGLESNITEMRKVGAKAFIVAVIGVVVPFLLGTYLIGPWLLPDFAFITHLFVGATLTATSVGITARVFKDLGTLNSKESQIVLGAAVIDDVLGLIILAVVSAIATVGAVGFGLIGWITAKAVLFLVGAIVIGQFGAPYVGKALSKIHTGHGMKFTFAISFGLLLAYLAHLIGLAPIIGAFAAGLVLDAVHFKTFRNPKIATEIDEIAEKLPEEPKGLLQKISHEFSHKHVEDLIEPLSFFLVPIFFLMTGFNVKLESLFSGEVLLLALIITVVAIIGKVVAGLGAGKVNKLLVGFGMVPRGEVGLIFVMIGRSLGVVSDQLFSAIVVMVILTTLCTPPILTYLIKKEKNKSLAQA